MSIDPVLATPAIDQISGHTSGSARALERSQAGSVQPNSGMLPSRQSSAPQKQTKRLELPRDEIQVQRDSQNQIIIKYLDGSGKVIFQIPSSQILALQQAIEQTLQQQHRSGANSRAASSLQGVRNGH